MGILSFMKEAGEKLFFPKDAKAASTPEANVDSIKKYIESQGIKTDGLQFSFDSAQDRVKITGTVPDQATKEKILLCAGNVQGVAAVDDNITVANAGVSSQYYTVKSGDTLSKIAKQYYGDAQKYNLIFEANRPMLSHPDKIYPGQTLRIPPQDNGARMADRTM